MIQTFLHVKKNDLVQVISGKEKGKTGKILRALPKQYKVIVEKLNMVKKHVRPKKSGEKGQIVSVARAVPASTVSLVCPKCNKPTRIGAMWSGDKKMRSCKRCEAQFA